MMLVDNQAGSKDLYPFIRTLTSSCILTRVDPPFGDIVWVGNGPDDTKVLKVAVEYKKGAEILGEIKGDSNRFVGHQVQGLVNHYDRRYLLIESRWRTDRESGLMVERRKDKWISLGITARDLEHWLTTIEEQAGFRIVRTFDEYESARWVFAKYTWYTAKGWADHTALHRFHTPLPPTATFIKPGVVRRIAKELVDIGWDRSIPVAAAFPSVQAMINAGVEEWSKIVVGQDKNGHTITLGKNRAAKIVNEIMGGGG